MSQHTSEMEAEHRRFQCCLIMRIAELEKVLVEARDHLYTKQDIDRVRAMARAALEGK